MISDENTARKVAEALLSIAAVKVKIDPPFTWTSGIKSPVYCDNRRLISYVEERRVVVDSFKKLIEERGLDIDVIAGTATAAIPWAAFLAYELEKPMVYIRPQKKEHGAGKQIEGDMKPGSKVLLVEDLISTGGSSLAAADAIKEEGQSQISEVFAIVSWELEKSGIAFEQANLNLTTLTDFTNLIGLAGERGDIPKEDIEKVTEFKKDPPAWGDKMGF